MPVDIRYPPPARHRGLGFWLRPSNVWASRRKIFRRDRSNEWRYAFEQRYPATRPPDRSVSFERLVRRPLGDGFRFILLADTGEGDQSQYALLPLIRALRPHFLIINGDVTYPAGSMKDYEEGFFTPYSGLGVPIWATPGNHEYYSKHHGAEFFEVFCTRVWERRWAEAGLPLVVQPGTYWELSDPEGRLPLVVLGLDTGMHGDLDGHGHGADQRQLAWLDARLKKAQAAGQIALVLFHIPLLHGQTLDRRPHLYQLHHLLGKYPCVRLVATGHVHNYQRYAPEVFRRFLDKVAPATRGSGVQPHYVVAGGGGAALSGTDYEKDDYEATRVFPTAAQWKAYANAAREAVEKAGLSRSLPARLIALMDKNVPFDDDPEGYHSFLYVEVEKNEVRVFPVLQEDLQSFYGHLPDGTVVDVLDPAFDPDAATVRRLAFGDPIALQP